MTPITPFCVAGALPKGTTVLEASAGTGKTWTIAALAARYVAEGEATLDQLLLVTFGRMATSELRARVRERLVDTERALAAALSGAPARADADEVERLLVDRPADELAVMHRRVRRALADFDAATIATTHEFCLQMLDGLGVLGDREPERRIVEHLTDLTHEVAGDIYLARYAAHEPPMTYPEAVELAERVIESSHGRLVPVPPAERPAPDDAGPGDSGPGDSGPGDSRSGESRSGESSSGESSSGDSSSGDSKRAVLAYARTAYAIAVREEVERRKRDRGLFSYDDMLTRLREALTDPVHGETACERLRQRFSVVLVDEFQDTDPVQWDILRRAFHRHVTMILIGDPKQAIYAFRGADVFSYLGAVERADARASLDTNWRSDAALVEATQQLMLEAALGDPRIVVREVRSAHPHRRLLGDGVGAPLRLRAVPRAESGEAARVAQIREAIEADIVADVTALLASGARLRLDPGDPADGRVLRPSDIAVLVRKNSRGEAIRDALIGAGVPTVL